MAMSAAATWDIFCAVVDNYGDIGVCWRLARQLAAEHALKVRLWVDDLGSLARLCPEVDAARDVQNGHGVEIRRWAGDFAGVEPACVVVEAFACELPPAYVAAMAARVHKPVWVNLEYLSAEPWVRDFHAAPSPHPSLPLVKYFYFPGFEAGTGGLLREADYGRGFVADTWWHKHGLEVPVPGEMRISLFAYENAALPALLEAWAAADRPVTCLLPEGRLLPVAAAWAGQALATGKTVTRGNLVVHVLPFLAQEDYDALLLACDLNFVRGEDSFVRAQWAGRPLVWQIYPQPEDAHWPKLEAFLDLYCPGLAPDSAAALRGFWHAWNGRGAAAPAWAEWLRHRPAFEAHAHAWKAAQWARQDLAAALVNFCINKI